MASTTQTTTTELPTDVTTPNISTPAETSLRMQIRVLTEKLEILEGILKGDNTIGIKGLSHLRTPAYSNGSWEDRLYALFFEARIPLPWFYEMDWPKMNPAIQTLNLRTFTLSTRRSKTKASVVLNFFFKLNIRIMKLPL